MRKESVRMLKRDRSVILALALGVLMFGAACSRSANSGNTSSTSGSNKSSSSSAPTSTSSSAGMSPSEVFKAYYDAQVRKDYDTVKKYLSQGTIQMMEEGAKKQGKTVDEALKESPGVSPSDMPQMSNEQINGDTATVDLMAQGQKITMPYVKEGGEWKLAMDKLLADMMGGHQPGGDKGDNEVLDNNNH
ncbi:MAG: hypothetical protein DMF68_04550 [Acidobacteria bacterium]|nr:MAG: hypothetical protein DMF68_04550 [Acidobacteriota bacterium]